MEILNEIREKAKELSIKAVKKSNEMAETLKSKFTIADKESEISKLSRGIGQIVYTAYKNAQEYPIDDVAVKCAEIDACYAEIDIIKEKLVDLKQIKICSECGFESPEVNKFCPRCGEDLG